MGAPLAAVTGGTGFLGRHVVRALADGGWRVRVLCRRDPVHPLWRGLEPELALGDLEDAASLHRLCRGADAVIHAAGLVKARRDADLRAANVDGAGRLAAAARAAAAPGANLVHVSSLAAREPQLSAYARSKRDGEAAVLDAWGATARLVRPCAVYGPGDRETLALFRMAGGPLLPVPAAPARVTLVHAADAARAVAALAGRTDAPAGPVALCDARADGYAWNEIMEAAAAAVGARPRTVGAPASLLRAAGLAGDAARRLGADPMATSGKVRELLHGDWSVPAAERDPQAPAARFGLGEGFADAVAWYRAQGWLRPRNILA